MLQGFHAAIAWRRGPHWLLNDQDAKQYGQALSNALRHLPVTMAQKWVDFSALGLAIFAYEGPRVAMDMQLRQQRRAAPPRPSGPAQVFQFRPPPGSPAAAGQASGAPPDPPRADGTTPPMTGPAPDMTYEPDYVMEPA